MEKNFWPFFLIVFIFFAISFGIFATEQKSISISITVPESGNGNGGGGGGGGGGGAAGYGKVIFSGKAYPNALITVLKNSSVASTKIVNAFGDFNIALESVPAGVTTFGFFAEDNKRRRSVTQSFTIRILENSTVEVSGIFISPTISLSSEIIRKGEVLDMSGQSYPQSEVRIFINSLETIIEKTEASNQGDWKYTTETGSFVSGPHKAKARASTLEGEQSPFSQEMLFRIIDLCQGADLNFDHKVDLIDFSILLYYWAQSEPANICADINVDRSVNLIDFSIMMYWWTG